MGTVLEMPCWSSGSVHNQTFQIRYAPIPSNTLAFNFYWGARAGGGRQNGFDEYARLGPTESVLDERVQRGLRQIN